MPAEGAQKANSSNLYLVTFLATLFLLLFVSCTIVLRSYLLRRRYQRQVELALAQGIILTPRTPGSRKKRYGARPRLYENWVAPLHVSGISGYQLPPTEKEPALLGGRWIDMLPLTVQTVVVKRRTRESLLSPTCSPLTAQSPEGHSLLTGVRFASPDAESQPHGRLGSLFSRFSRPSPPTSQSQIAFPRPSGSETPTNAATLRDRRESQTNWRTIVTPSPSLAMAGAVDAVSATARVRSLSTPGDRRSRRMSMPASPPTALLPSSNSHNNTGTSTPNGTSSSGGLFSAFRGRRNSTIAATSSPPPVPPLPQPQPQSQPGDSIARAPESVPDLPSSSVPAPTNRTRARININTNVPNPSTVASAPSPGGLVSSITPTLMTAVTTAVSPTAGSAMMGGGSQLSKTRIRTEMLQISVLVAMPDVRTSRLYGDAGEVKKAVTAKMSLERKSEGGEKEESGHRKTKRRKEAEAYGEDDSSVVSSESEDEEEEYNDVEDEDEDEVPLPELVLGVTRLTYRYGNALASPSTPMGPPAFVIPSSPPPPPPATVPVPAAVAALERQRERAASIRQLTHA